MNVLLYVVCGLFALMGLGGFSAAWLGRSPRLFLGAICYFGSASLAFALISWWPLLVGFLLAYVVRAVFGDPSRP